jgi:polysaccharide chain length determinant protein (PEP-CTERM system associated)
MVTNPQANLSKPRDWEHYWALVRRRRWWFLIPVFIGWSIVWGLGWLLPPLYRSQSFILVEGQKVPKDYVVPNVTADLANRLQTLTQQVLSRTQLSRIIKEFALYPRQSGRLSPDELVDVMRKDIQIDLVQDKRREELTAFKISFSSGDPHTAQSVINELTSLFIDENLKTREQLTESTTDFLRNELEDAGKTLAEQEQKIRDFKTRYLGQLPGQLQSNVQILTGLQSQAELELDALNRAKQQNLYLQSLLEQYRTVQGDMGQGKDSPVHSPASDQELVRLGAELTGLRARYTEKHPDVQKLEDQIAATEQMKERIATDFASTAANSSTDSKSPAVVGNPDPRESGPIMELESQLKANQLEIQDRQHELKDLQTRTEEYRARLNETPIREQQFADLTRDYEQSQSNYGSLLAKRNQSELATNLEKRQQGEQFQLLDPPSFPDKPYWPERLVWSWVGLGIGIALGFSVTAAAELIDDRIRDEEDLKQVLPVTILAEIPLLTANGEDKRKRWRRSFEWCTATILLAAMTAGFVITYYRG